MLTPVYKPFCKNGFYFRRSFLCGKKMKTTQMHSKGLILDYHSKHPFDPFDASASVALRI
jgi:hypothetical protein